ncbi:50S ribosomal protein L22 [Candidatus Margulisiibacteriota bacterium]
METKAQAKYVRVSTRKVKIVADLIRGKLVNKALAMLSFMPHHGARVTEEVLKSAVANAKHNYKLDPEKLFISKIFADRATPFKRWRAQARGRAVQILHRQSHVTVYVSPLKEKAPVKKGTAKSAAPQKKEEAKRGSKGTSKRV